jgi:hypothetical protein
VTDDDGSMTESVDVRVEGHKLGEPIGDKVVAI